MMLSFACSGIILGMLCNCDVHSSGCNLAHSMDDAYAIHSEAHFPGIMDAVYAALNACHMILLRCPEMGLVYCVGHLKDSIQGVLCAV